VNQLLYYIISAQIRDEKTMTLVDRRTKRCKLLLIIIIIDMEQ